MGQTKQEKCTHPSRRDETWQIGGVPYAVRVCTKCGHSLTVGLGKIGK